MNILAIEGVDGAGKTTLCNFLQPFLSSYNIGYIKTPSKLFSNLTKTSRKNGGIASFFSFLLADISITFEFKCHDWLIVDRYILSSFVYHHQSISEIKDEILPLLKYLNLETPRATIFLEANSELIKERLGTRNQSSNHFFETEEIKALYNEYLSNSYLKPWLSNTMRMKSENYNDLLMIKDTILALITE